MNDIEKITIIENIKRILACIKNVICKLFDYKSYIFNTYV